MIANAGRYPMCAWQDIYFSKQKKDADIERLTQQMVQEKRFELSREMCIRDRLSCEIFMLQQPDDIMAIAVLPRQRKHIHKWMKIMNQHNALRL